MAENFDRAWETKKIVLDDAVGIAAGDYDPSTSGHEGPVGSRFYRSNGNEYVKTGAGDTEWDLQLAGVGYVGGFIPFWRANGASDPIPLDVSGAIPFWRANGDYEPISVVGV
ncbi:MAG: hypothetical protein KAJ73_00390 [Zetaproteobacteria bacterium]|nr:hypothetical protein [Zetaproteobacteria bacterium]